MNVPQSLQAALAHHQAGRLAQARPIYEQLLAADPNNVDALHYLGVLHHQQGNSPAGIQLMQRSLALNPKQPSCHSNLGEAFFAIKRLDLAVECYRRAIQLDPKFPEAWSNLCNALRGMGKLKEALSAGQRALQLRPNFWAAMQNLANALGDLNEPEQAIGWYRRAAQLDPTSAQGFANWGATALGVGDLDQAVTMLRKSVEIDPTYGEAWNNLAAAMMDLSQLDQAHECSLKALQHKPEPGAHSNLLLGLHYRDDRAPAEVFQEHVKWASIYAAPLAKAIRPHTNTRDPDRPDRPLRIGYLSPDFRRHSVAYFLEPVLANHDRTKFQVYGYAHVRKVDDYTDRLRGYTHQWRDIMGLSDEQAFDLIRADGVDILVDLAGHTASNRLPLFAARPAPVQLTWLGYPDTTGMAAMDWRITDSLADPRPPGESDALHTEKLWRLDPTAWCYRAPEESAPIGPVPSSTGAPITFASFNNFAKVSPAVLAAWAKILHAVPGSRLILKSKALGSRIAQDFARKSLADLGISPARVQLLAKVQGLANHFDFYNRVDVALDTFPYNGTTTTCEALWMGVPVISLVGHTHVARVGKSLLSSVGLPDLLADTVEEYIAKAIALSRDPRAPARLSHLRSTLRPTMQSSPLMDAAGFTRRMEEAMRGMWGRWCGG